MADVTISPDAPGTGGAIRMAKRQPHAGMATPRRGRSACLNDAIGAEELEEISWTERGERILPRIPEAFGGDPSRWPSMKASRPGAGSEPEEQHPHAMDQPSAEVADQDCWQDVVPNRAKAPDCWSFVAERI